MLSPKRIRTASSSRSAEATAEPGTAGQRIRRAAMDLLARREHSVAELRERLLRRFGAEADAVEPELARLVDERLLDDTRFAEACVRMHRNRGHGPLRVLHELARRGVDSGLAEQVVASRDAEWIALARAWRKRRFGAAMPTGAAEWQRQARHLQGRGFDAEQVQQALRGDRD